MSANFHIDPSGEFVEFTASDDTGLTPGVVIRVDVDEVQTIHHTMRSLQLGTDTTGDL